MRNTALASHRAVRARYPMLSRAILAGASAQLRNMATVGGNLLQRTRCSYFYDARRALQQARARHGLRRVGGFTRYHAILGASADASPPTPRTCAWRWPRSTPSCISRHRGERSPVADLHRLPGERPDIETALQPGELITAVDSRPPLAARSTYRKVRDRASYAFALVSVAAALEVDGRRNRDVRLALGGVAPKPWRARRAEAALRGGAGAARRSAAADAELADAEPLARQCLQGRAGAAHHRRRARRLAGEAA